MLDPTPPVRLHQGVAAKLVRLKGLLPQTDVPALVARHTGLLSTDPAAMAASLDALRCTATLRRILQATQTCHVWGRGRTSLLLHQDSG